MKNITITEDSQKVCIEWNGSSKRWKTVTKALYKALPNGCDDIIDEDYIKRNLDDNGELCDITRDGVIGEKPQEVINALHLCTDVDGNYFYGCVILNKKHYY